MVEIELMTQDPLYQMMDACQITTGKRASKPSSHDYYFNHGEDLNQFIKFFICKHSVIRTIQFKITDDHMRADIMSQIIRATKGHPQPFCQSHRPDKVGGKRLASNETFSYYQEIWTPESFMDMASQRLCYRAMPETREWVVKLVNKMSENSHPLFQALSLCCVPTCVFQRGCPELKSCGFFDYNFIKECLKSTSEKESIRSRYEMYYKIIGVNYHEAKDFVASLK